MQWLNPSVWNASQPWIAGFGDGGESAPGEAEGENNIYRDRGNSQ